MKTTLRAMAPVIFYVLAAVYVCIGWLTDNSTYDTIAAIWMLAGFIWEKRE